MLSLRGWSRRACSTLSGHPANRRKLIVETLEERINPSLGFGFAVGGDTSGSSTSIATTTDSSGNVYITGSFSGTVHFGVKTTLTALTAQANATDAFVAKYSSTGTFDWVAELGDPGTTTATTTSTTTDGYAIAVDASGNVYTTGWFQGASLNFDPNSTNHQLSSSNNGTDTNAFVSELNPSGQYVMAVALGSGGTAHGLAITVDGSGNIYTTGFFYGTDLNFDPNSSNHQLSSSSSGGDRNVYISELNNTGQYIMAVSLGSGGNANPIAIAVNSSGDIITTGEFVGTHVNFDPNSSNEQMFSLPNEYYNVYVSELNSSGQYVFAVPLGYGGAISSNGNVPYSRASFLALDGSGNIYVDGGFTGNNLNFDPTPTADIVAASETGDTVTITTSAPESFQVGQQVTIGGIGTAGYNGSFIITSVIDSTDFTYTDPTLALTPDDNGGSASVAAATQLSAGNSQAAFVVKLNSSGQYVFADALGIGGVATAAGLAVDSSDNVYTTGYFEGANVNFDPNSTAHQLSTTAAISYISELNSSGKYVNAIAVGTGGAGTLSISEGITVDGENNIYVTGFFEGTNVNFNPFGSDALSAPIGSTSFFLLKLTQLQINTTTLPNGYIGQVYDETISASNGTPPYTFSVSSGEFPSGLNLNPTTGEIEGYPNFNGIYPFVITVTDADGYTTSQSYTVQIGVQITTPSFFPSGTIGAYYDQTITVSNATAPYTFSIINGALPTGLTLNPTTGEIKGTTSVGGSFLFEISVTDANGESATQYCFMIVDSQYTNLAYAYSYNAYIYAYYAYATGLGSYNAFLFEYLAQYYSQQANVESLLGEAADAAASSYYAYYYGYFGQYYAYEDYAQSGKQSVDSYYAYYDGYFGQYYSYYAALGL